MPRQPLNLSVDPEALERARRFVDARGTSLSQLVTDFFATLPLEGEERCEEYPPAVRRLIGIGRGDADIEDYRAWLREKHGS